MADSPRSSRDTNSDVPNTRTRSDLLWTRRSVIASVAAGLALGDKASLSPAHDRGGSTGKGRGSRFVAFVEAWPDSRRSAEPPGLDRLLERIRDAGLDGVDFGDAAFLRPDELSRVGAVALNLGAPIVGLVFSDWGSEGVAAGRTTSRELGLLLGRLAALGGRMVTIRLRRTTQPRTAVQFETAAETLQEMLALCHSHGITLALWTAAAELEYREYTLKNILTRVPGLSLAADLDSLSVAGINPFDFIARYSLRVSSLHWREKRAERFGTGGACGSAGATLHRKLSRAGFVGRAVIELGPDVQFERIPFAQEPGLSRNPHDDPPVL